MFRGSAREFFLGAVEEGEEGAFLLCNRHRTGGSNDLIGIGAGGEIEEGLSGFAEGLAGAGGQDEGR